MHAVIGSLGLFPGFVRVCSKDAMRPRVQGDMNHAGDSETTDDGDSQSEDDDDDDDDEACCCDAAVAPVLHLSS